MISTSDAGDGAITLRPPDSGDVPAELETLCRWACARFGVKKIYFARALGRRRHYLGGFGEETYLPPEAVQVGPDLWAFIEGTEDLPPEERRTLRHLLETAGRRLAASLKGGEEPQ